MDKYSQLESINSLKERGVLTEEEFQIEKKKILGEKGQVISSLGYQEIKQKDFGLIKLVPNRLNQKMYIKCIFFYMPIIWFVVMMTLGVIVLILYKSGLITLSEYQGHNIFNQIGALVGSYLRIPSLLVALCFYIILSISRFHDIGKSGWYILIPIYGIIAPLITQGTKGDNRFGSKSE